YFGHLLQTVVDAEQRQRPERKQKSASTENDNQIGGNTSEKGMLRHRIRLSFVDAGLLLAFESSKCCANALQHSFKQNYYQLIVLRHHQDLFSRLQMLDSDAK